MSGAPFTPEEKLLRIIESPPKMQPRMAIRRGAPDIKVLFKLFEAKYKEKFENLFNLKILNFVLIFLAVVATIFLCLDFWIGLPRTSIIENLELTAKKVDVVSDLAFNNLDGLDDYLQEIIQSNIFALPDAVKAPEVKKEEAAPAELTGIVQSCKVVGIIWSEAPQAIVEDAKEAKTYLLNRGSKLRNARVKDILKDRVILSYDNQEAELK